MRREISCVFVVAGKARRGSCEIRPILLSGARQMRLICAKWNTRVCVCPANNGEAFSQKISSALCTNARLVLIKTWDILRRWMDSTEGKKQTRCLWDIFAWSFVNYESVLLLKICKCFCRHLKYCLFDTILIILFSLRLRTPFCKKKTSLKLSLKIC